MRSTQRSSFFLPYQQRWIEDKSQFKIMEKARQVGISWATAYSAVRKQCLKDASLDTWVSSRDITQAQLFLEDCHHFASALNIAFMGKGKRKTAFKSTADVLTLANGRKICALSSSPNAQAGKRGTRILDEFALHQDPHLLYSVAMPGLAWGGSLEIISTHRGTQNFFYQLLEEIKHKGNPKNFSWHKVTLQSALEEGFLERLQEKLPADDVRQQMKRADYFDYIRKSCPDEETFQQEYMCEVADDESAFLSYQLFNGCTYPEGFDWSLSLKNQLNPTRNQLVLGVDIGRDHDLTVFWLLELADGMLLTRHITCLKDTPFAQQAAVLDDYLKLHKLHRVAIDQTGIGRQLVEDAIRRHGKYRVEGVTFTQPVKEALAYPVRSAFESKTIQIPKDEYLIADLRSVKKELTAAGHIRFTAPRLESGHADHFWALALAIYASHTQPHYATQYEALSPRFHRSSFLS